MNGIRIVIASPQIIAGDASRMRQGADTSARWLIAIFFVSLPMSVLLPASVAAAERQYDNVSVEQLTQTINVGDWLGMNHALSEIRQKVSWEKRADPQVVAFLWDLWNERTDRHPELDWRMAKRPAIFSEVAGTLVFLSVRGLHETDLAPFREYGRNLVGDPNLFVSLGAMNILQMVDNPDDVPLIYAAALEEGGGKFRGAVLTLAAMCNSVAAEALSRLRAVLKEPEQRTFIDEQLRAFGGRSRQIRGCK